MDMLKNYEVEYRFIDEEGEYCINAKKVRAENTEDARHAIEVIGYEVLEINVITF